MHTDNTFKKFEWIGRQRSWAIAPPALKKIAAQWFLIPRELEHNILPSPYLPIANSPFRFKMHRLSRPISPRSSSAQMSQISAMRR
jgi:hypothetical protein